MTIWGDNVSNTIGRTDIPNQNIEICGNCKLLALQFAPENPDDDNYLQIICRLPEEGNVKFTPKTYNLSYFNYQCDVLYLYNSSGTSTDYNVFWTDTVFSEESQLWGSDYPDNNYFFLSHTINYPDIFIMGFLILFAGYLIFKTVWNFFHPVIVKQKNINDL